MDVNSNHPLFYYKFFCSVDFFPFKEDLTVAMEGESTPREKRLQQAMPDMLMRVDGVRESHKAYIQVVRDKVE
jgi:hypothetical protein